MKEQYEALNLVGGYDAFQCKVFEPIKNAVSSLEEGGTILSRGNLQDDNTLPGLEYQLWEFDKLDKPDKPITSRTIEIYFRLLDINYSETIKIELPEEQKEYWNNKHKEHLRSKFILKSVRDFVFEEMLKENDEIIKKRQGL